MIPFYFNHGLSYQKIIKKHQTCWFLFQNIYKNLGFFDINLFFFYIKKIAKILNFFFIKNLKIQILFEDSLLRKYRYFWKDNTFFSKFLQLNYYNKIRLTLLKNFQINFNYFTKKNKFYSALNKTFFKKFLKQKEKIFKTKLTQTIPDLLILSNPLDNKYTNQALLRQIPTILFTDSSQNLNNYTYFIGINTKTEIKLILFLNIIKKIMQFFFFTKNIKILLWKYYFLKKNKRILKFFFILNKTKFKKIYIFFPIKKNLKNKIKKHIKNENFKCQKNINSLYKIYFKIFKENQLKKNINFKKNFKYNPLNKQNYKQQKFFFNKKQQIIFQKKNDLLKNFSKFSILLQKN